MRQRNIWKELPPTEEVLALLEHVLKIDTDWLVRETAVKCLIRINFEVEGVVPILLKSLRFDNEWRVRVAAAKTLRYVVGRRKLFLPLVLDALSEAEKDEDHHVVYVATQIKEELAGGE